MELRAWLGYAQTSVMSLGGKKGIARRNVSFTRSMISASCSVVFSLVREPLAVLVD